MSPAHVRPAVPADLPALTSIYNHYVEHTLVTFDVEPFTVEQRRESVETTVYCDPAAVGRGLGSALYGELLAVLAGEGLHRAYAGVALPNDASLRLHERFGFRDLGTFAEVGGKHGQLVDVRWFERPLP